MKIANSSSNRSVDSLTAAQPDINATVSASAGTGKTWLLVLNRPRCRSIHLIPGHLEVVAHPVLGGLRHEDGLAPKAA
ncbi:MAG: hypothetical protein WBO73_15130 [Gammaproteobacteria bacterium]